MSKIEKLKKEIELAEGIQQLYYSTYTLPLSTNLKTVTNAHNNVDDIKIIKTYLEFLYENGEVYVDGTWYKSPIIALSVIPREKIKRLCAMGKVFRRVGLERL